MVHVLLNKTVYASNWKINRVGTEDRFKVLSCMVSEGSRKLEWDLQAPPLTALSLPPAFRISPFTASLPSACPPPAIHPGQWASTPPPHALGPSPFTKTLFVPGLWPHGTVSRQPIRWQAEAMVRGVIGCGTMACMCRPEIPWKMRKVSFCSSW